MTNRCISNLINVIAESMESDEQINNPKHAMNQEELAQYCATTLGGKWQTVTKVAWIKVIETAIPGKVYSTITRDEDGGSWQESEEVAKDGQYLVQNVYGDDHKPNETQDPSKWLITDKQIKSNYQVQGNVQVGTCYQPEPKPRQGMKLEEPITFVAAWGKEMNGKKDDWLVKNGEKDIYRIDKTVFFNTYEIGG